VSIHKSLFLFKIPRWKERDKKAFEKNNRPDGKSIGTGRHMVDIQKIIF